MQIMRRMVMTELNITQLDEIKNCESFEMENTFKGLFYCLPSSM